MKIIIDTTKDNHIIGCQLEGLVDFLRIRGFERESFMMDEIASRMK